MGMVIRHNRFSFCSHGLLGNVNLLVKSCDVKENQSRKRNIQEHRAVKYSDPGHLRFGQKGAI